VIFESQDMAFKCSKNEQKSRKQVVKITPLPELEDISKEELYLENISLKEKVVGLQFQINQFNRLVFGQTRERFVPSQTAQQTTLFSPQQGASTTVGETESMPHNTPRTDVKKKGQQAGKPNPNHNGRNQFPAHLPRVVEILTPEIVAAKPTDFNKIGQEITETLDYTPAQLIVKQYVREKYVAAHQQPSQNTQNTVEHREIPHTCGEGVLIAPMPERPLPKAIAEAGLLAQVMIDKYVDHLPIDRQAKRWKRESGIDISGSTVVGWQSGVHDLMMPLYEKLVELVFDCTYMQADESTMQCLEDAPKGKSHRSYQWVYRNVEKGLILFDYQRGRSGDCLHPRVKSHQGFLQTDGYSVYDALEGLPNLILMNCFAHARREFFESKENDPQRAEKALEFIQQLYKIEENIKQDRQDGLDSIHIKQRRSEKIIPILIEFKTWLEEQRDFVLPKSPIGRAIAYTLNRWAKLTVFTTDGALEIDNNRIENAIRPLALGRKNYLFAASDEGGKRAAMMYSFFATCKIHNVNPLEWLSDVLRRLPSHPINKIDELLPHFWRK
jgi:transposase